MAIRYYGEGWREQMHQKEAGCVDFIRGEEMLRIA